MLVSPTQTTLHVFSKGKDSMAGDNLIERDVQVRGRDKEIIITAHL